MTLIQVWVDEAFVGQVDVPALRRAAAATLAHQGVGDAVALTVWVRDDEALREWNRRFRGVDAPTDVLSFPDGEEDPESNVVYLGDVLISYSRALAQAEAGGHAVADELALLVVHGVLHLLGHDHATPAEKERMWAAQREILQALGCPLDPP